MCGIFGHYKPGGADPALVERMAVCLSHRGPDGYGTHHAGDVAFGAGRLAIIDLAADAGPIFSEDRRVAVAYNGEIYNYKALRTELERLGHHFATLTDTEVIVHGYESWGVDVLGKLRGMFALCIWDSVHDRLVLARDRLGEKPLYFTWMGGEFLFASEIKALFEHPRLPREVEPTALLNYLALGYVPAPLTMFAGIEKLSPGEMLILDRGEAQRHRYWQPIMDTTQPMDYAESVRRVREALIEAVEMRLMSDVPIGAFLSGGVDSTAVVAIMGRAMGRPVQTFTVGFEMGDAKSNAKFNVDSPFAARAAEHLGSDHHSITIQHDVPLTELLPQLVYQMDEPMAEQAVIQTAYVAALARLTGVPVLLTGDCGDELFAGYRQFRTDRVLERYLQIPGLVRSTVLTPLLEHLPARFDSARKLAEKSRDVDPVRRYLAWRRNIELERLPDLMSNTHEAKRGYQVVSASLLPLLNAPRTRHFADRIAYTLLGSWIPEDSNMRVDKMSMLMSTEARAPFEDHHLVELALRIPLGNKLQNGGFKMVLKDAVSDFVPRDILERSKWGFIPPISIWLRTLLRPLVEEYLSPERVAAAGFFQPEAVTRLVDAHIVQNQYEVWPVWTLLIFHLWHAMYIDGSLKLDHQLTPGELMPRVAV
jgi:asparagine synthase (glutamine-hydrolysing)